MRRKCNKCGKIKNVKEFYSNGRHFNGDKKISYICKICDNLKRKKYPMSNRRKLNDEEKEIKKEYDRKRYLEKKLLKILL